MIGLLLVTHGTFGESLVQNICHVLGACPPNLEQLSVSAKDKPEDLFSAIHEKLKKLDDGHGVLILTDVYGATPANTVAKILIPERIEGVCGVNFPMLLRAVCYRNQPMKELVEKVVNGGREGIMSMQMQ